MTVVKSKRKESVMLFYHLALEIRKNLTFRILKDFGIKPYIRQRSILAQSSNLTQEEQNELNILLDKCSSVTIIDEFPQWYIEHERTILLKTLDSLFTHIINANTIYATNENELAQRRYNQTLAIADCQRLIRELQFIIDIIPTVQAEKLKVFIELTLKEINLLKAWRKSNKILNRQSSITSRSVNSSTNFCNANNNGNANNNNASNSNGVRPRSYGYNANNESAIMPQKENSLAL